MKNLAAALIATLTLLAACETAVPGGSAALPATAPVPIAADLPAVSARRAIDLFDSICGASLPDFATADQRLAANSVTVPSPEGTLTRYSSREDISFQLQDGPGQGRTCSMVYGTSSPQDALALTTVELGPFVETPLGPGAIYRGTQGVVLIGGESTVALPEGTRTYLNLRLVSDR